MFFLMGWVKRLNFGLNALMSDSSKLTLQSGQYFWVLLQSKMHLLWKKCLISQGSAITGSPCLKLSMQKAHSLWDENILSLYTLSLIERMLSSSFLPISSCLFRRAIISCSRAIYAWCSISIRASLCSSISRSLRFSSSYCLRLSSSTVVPCYLAIFRYLALSFFACLRSFVFIFFSSSIESSSSSY